MNWFLISQKQLILSGKRTLQKGDLKKEITEKQWGLGVGFALHNSVTQRGFPFLLLHKCAVHEAHREMSATRSDWLHAQHLRLVHYREKKKSIRRQDGVGKMDGFKEQTERELQLFRGLKALCPEDKAKQAVLCRTFSCIPLTHFLLGQGPTL